MVKANSVFEGFRSLLLTLVSSVVLILVGIIYFMVTVFIVKVGAQWAGMNVYDPSTVILTAGIISAAAMVGSALQK